MTENDETSRERLDRLENRLLEQEHRLVPAVRNFLLLRDKRRGSKDDKERYAAARWALVYRVFLQASPVAISVGGMGLVGVLVGLWSAELVREQNHLFDEQNYLLSQQNRGLFDQFQSEAADREVARKAQMIDIIYSCGESDQTNDCEPRAHPLARIEAFAALVAIEERAGGRVWLEGARVNEVRLARSRLIQANLERSQLVKADLRGARLCGSHMRGVDLRGARFEGANLERAILVGAKLGAAEFAGANLSGADLGGADLRGSTVSQEQLDSAVGGIDGGAKTLIPPRLVAPEHWQRGSPIPGLLYLSDEDLECSTGEASRL